MKCRECAEGKRIGNGGVLCLQYGFIIGRDHECTREGRKQRDGGEDQSGEVFGETELFSAAGEDFGEVPGIL